MPAHEARALSLLRDLGGRGNLGLSPHLAKPQASVPLSPLIPQEGDKMVTLGGRTVRRTPTFQ